jgi:hypothetical protein
MPQLAIAAAGAWIGGATLGTGVVALGMTGTAIGWTAGSLLGSLLFAPKGPKAQIGDTRAPKIDHGSKMPRVYSTYRVPLNPRWLPEFTAESQSAGGKGGGGGSEYYTYTSSPLYWAADGTNIQGVSRIWMNGELVWTALAASDATSLANSANSQHWDEMEFFDGNGAQLPWSVYEAAVGSANADAHRNIACIGFTNLKCGNSPQLPFMEAEIYTNATAGDAIWRNHVRFADDDASDTSYYDATPVFADGTEGVDYTISGGVFRSINGGGTTLLTWSGAHLKPQNGVPITMQVKGCLTVPEMQFTPSLYEYASDTFVFVIGANTSFGFGDQWRFHVRHPGDPSGSFHGGFFASGEMHHCELIVTPVVSGLTVTSGTIDIYVDGQLVDSDTFGSTPIDSTGYCAIYSPEGITSEGIEVEYAGTAFAALHTANFTPPADLPPADGPSVIPGPEDLADIVSAECLRSGLTAGEIDVTALVGTEVAGFKCEGTAADAIGQLMGAFYFYCLPGRKLVFRLMDAASVATIQAADTGAGVDQASEVFAGLMRGNDLELPAQVSITAPNPSADYDPATATSDRIITVGNRIEQAQLAVVFTPAELKGRANANVLDARVAAHTATLSVDDTFAAYEPGDVITHVDEEGNSYITRWVKESYQQGVKTIDLRLFDRSVLTLTGTMSDTYTPALTVTAPAVPILYLFDSPILRDADDGHGIYATVTADGDWQGAELFLSRDDVTYESVGTFANRGVVGTATELGDFTGWTWDTANSMTVTLDAGTDGLTASTKAAIEADATVNVALVGTHERWEAVRFANASLLGADTYLLSDFLRGQFGTEHANPDHAAGDTFVLMRTTGVIRVPLVSTDLGNTLYLKAVPPGVALSAVTATTIEYTAEGLKPYAPVNVTASRSSNGDLVVTWNRRSRFASPFLSLTDPPLGEDSESYTIGIYSPTFAAFKRTLTASTASVTYTLAQQEADFGSIATALAVRVQQIGAMAGHESDQELAVASTGYFAPLAMNAYPDIRLAQGTRFLITRNGLTAMGLYRWTVGDPEAELLGTVSADNSYRYLQGAHMHASDGTTWVMYLRGYTNQSAQRKLVRGNLAAGTFAVVVPAFMPSDPPIALGHNGTVFIAITVAGDVWHSADGDSWSNEGTVSGIALPPSAADLSIGRMFIVGSTLVLSWVGDLFYDTALDGLSWSAATGDVTTDPATYTAAYAIVGADGVSGVGCALAFGVDGSAGQYAIVYTTTDGQAWAKRATEITLSPLNAGDSVLQNAVIAFDGNFFVRAAAGAAESGFVNRRLIGTWSGASVYRAPALWHGISAAGSSRLVTVDSVTFSQPVASDSGDVFNETIDWPT